MVTVVVSALAAVPVPESVLVRVGEAIEIDPWAGATDGCVNDVAPRSVELESFAVALLLVITGFAGGNSS